MKFTSKESKKTYQKLMSEKKINELTINSPSKFELGGRLYLGKYSDAAKIFSINNPTGGDFSVWLQNYWIQIN